MFAFIELVIVGWLPGAVMFRLPLADRDRRAALPAEERAYWTVLLSVATSLSLVVSLAALHRYSFKRLVIADLLIAAALALAARFDLRLGKKARLPGLAACIPLVLALIGAWRFLPASEYIIGGKDPGVYVNSGIQIAQRGAIVVLDPAVAAVPAFARDLFVPRDANRDRFVGPRFMGFFVLDPDTGAVVSQFPHVFPASIAIGYALDGLTGARRTFVFWGVLGLLSVYFAGARLLGRPAAAAAAILLALHVVQVWFSRYPNADIVMQAILFAALLANARAHVDDDPFFAPVAGALLALLLFLRFDAVVAVAAVVASLALGYIAQGSAGRRGPLAAGCALCVLTPMREYFELPLVFISHLPTWEYVVAAIGSAGLLTLVVVARRSPKISQRVVDVFPTALSLAVVALAAYALVFRQPGGKLTDYDAFALRNFADYYFTRGALVVAVIGYVLVVRGLFWRDPAFILTLTAFSVFFFYKIRIAPEHFWAARRFIPVILPGGLLLVAAAALTGLRGRLLFSRAIRGPIGIVFIAFLAVQYARAAKPVVDHVEYQGIIPRLEKLAGQIGDDDLLLVESRNAGSDVHVLGCRWPTLYTQRPRLLERRPGQDDVRGVPRVRTREIPPRSVPRRRRHRLAFVALERRAAAKRSLPDSGVRVGEERVSPLRETEGVRVQPLHVRAAGCAGRAQRARHRRQRRSERDPVPRQGTDGGTDDPLVPGAIVHHRQPDWRRRSHARALDERRRPSGGSATGGRDGADEGSGPRHGARRRRFQGVRPPDFRRGGGRRSGGW